MTEEEIERIRRVVQFYEKRNVRSRWVQHYVALARKRLKELEESNDTK